MTSSLTNVDRAVSGVDAGAVSRTGEGKSGAAAAPRAAEALGLDDRYRYFFGRSGRRYLFSAVPVEALEDYRGAVVVLLPRRSGGAVWIGEVDRYGQRRGAPIASRDLSRRIAYVHLLAGRPDERRAVADDLSRASSIFAVDAAGAEAGTDLSAAGGD